MVFTSSSRRSAFFRARATGLGALPAAVEDQCRAAAPVATRGLSGRVRSALAQLRSTAAELKALDLGGRDQRQIASLLTAGDTAGAEALLVGNKAGGTNRIYILTGGIAGGIYFDEFSRLHLGVAGVWAMSCWIFPMCVALALQ